MNSFLTSGNNGDIVLKVEFIIIMDEILKNLLRKKIKDKDNFRDFEKLDNGYNYNCTVVIQD